MENIPTKEAHIPDFFNEILERIRDIRTSENNMYLRVKELFVLAADYQACDPQTSQFFRNMQNKLHFASTGFTAAELVSLRVNAHKPNAGLTNFKGDEVRKADVTIAKNYLQPNEIKALNRIVVMWLNYAEDQALQRRHILLQDWEEKLDVFLAFNNRKVLKETLNTGRENANQKAKREFDKYVALLSTRERMRSGNVMAY